MEKIRFLNYPSVYNGNVSVHGNIITITFSETIPPQNILTNGFELLNENNGLVQGNYTAYTTIYRTYEDNNMLIELSNNGSIYVPPIVIEPEEPEPYVPTPEELEEIFKQNKNNKIALSKIMLAEYLENNPIHSTAHGNKNGVYSVTSDKQNLMMSQYMTYQIEKSIDSNAKLTWNETGKSCEEWTEDEFLQLILEIKTYVYPLVSYQQHVEENIYKCITQDELDNILIDYSNIS
ncbi:MAG: hypothetical protein NC400_02220 [Clostridium sp.]|nr:hypothetical protein [Clostridium sp.]